MVALCPQMHVLEQYVAESLPDESREDLQVHLSSCDKCRRRVDEISQGALFVEEMRGLLGGREPLPRDSDHGLDDVAGALEDLGRAPRASDAAQREAQVRGRLAELGRARPTDERLRRDKEIGRGGMGAVHEVWDHDLRRKLAMKVLLAKEAARPTAPEKLQRFLAEAEVTAQLDHPGIVPVHELGVDEDARVFFTMKLVEGRTLSDVIEDLHGGAGDTNLVRVLGILSKVCDAVAFAHERGVVHRDLKPANVMVGEFGEVYVMDWGLARLVGLRDVPDEDLEAGGVFRTHEGRVLGTPVYMPPEQAAGKHSEVGPQADVYAIGAMLYQALTGHPPYCGDERRPRSANEAIARVLSGPPRALGRDVPAELAAICEKAMERAPRARYHDVRELGNDLAAFLEGRVVRAFETGALAELRKWVRRNRALAGSLASAALLLVVGFVVSAFLYSWADAEAEAVKRLADIQDIERLIASGRDLWPVHPDRIEDFEDWLAEARAVLADEDLHRATLEQVRARASGVDADGEPVFDDPSDRWWHAELRALLERAQQLGGSEEGLVAGFSPAFGWGVERRLATALSLPASLAEEPGGAWARTIEEVRTSPHYGGLELEHHFGLQPLGADPATGLHEFAALLTGEAPARDPDTGEFALTEESAVVLVLLPGGRYLMGAQADDPSGPNYDPAAKRDERVLEVALDPFFLSKYELTQAQWLRLTAHNPSKFRPEEAAPDAERVGPPPTLLHPVEYVSRDDCVEVLSRVGMVLPTEAQWEYAARSGDSRRFATGEETGSLFGYGNFADATFLQANPSWAYDAFAFADGFPGTSPVGTFRPNDFGLFDVAGNVIELCADGYVQEIEEVRGGDGRILGGAADRFSFRGCCYMHAGDQNRCAYRFVFEQGNRVGFVGVRPAAPARSKR